MTINDQLIEAFNDCINRLNQGEAIETILSDYPDLATQLYPMLEAGLVVKKARYPVADMTIAQDKLAPQIQATIDTTFGGGSTSIKWFGVILILLLVGSIIIGIYSLNRETDVTQIAVTVTSLQESPMVTDSSTATIPPATSTSEQTMEVVTIIEGPVSNIQGNDITIYEQNIQLAPDDPRLTVMQLGDVLRVETSQDGQSIISLDITFVNVLVIVNTSEQIWRGDDCNNPPPAWIEGDTSSWFIQCNAGNPNNNSSNPGSGNNDNDNDSDDDDD